MIEVKNAPKIGLNMDDYHHLIADRVAQLSHLFGRPVDYIEVGVLTGNSAKAVLSTGMIAHATLVDNFSNTHCGETKSSPEIVERNLAAYDGLFTIAVGDSRNVLPLISGSGQQFDVGFVDGEHTDAACWDDMANMWPLIREGGVMFVDDLRNPVSLTGVVERFAFEHGLTMKTHDVHNGLGELTRK